MSEKPKKDLKELPKHPLFPENIGNLSERKTTEEQISEEIKYAEILKLILEIKKIGELSAEFKSLGLTKKPEGIYELIDNVLEKRITDPIERYKAKSFILTELRRIEAEEKQSVWDDIGHLDINQG